MFIQDTIDGDRDQDAGMSALLRPLRAAMTDFEEGPVRAALDALFADDAVVRLCHPLREFSARELWSNAYAGLHRAWPDLERRDWIVIAGADEHGAAWIGAGGHYMGTAARPWLDIPATGHAIAMRFHEFFRVEDARVVEMQAIWDIPEVMMQAGAWPMAPSLGREWLVPGPATQDGLDPHGGGNEARDHVIAMLGAMKRHPGEGGPELMEMERFWHPRMSWYGPAGIGTARGVEGFRNWHQIPFLAAMPDRGSCVDQIRYHLFGDGSYAGVTGWPNMIQTLTGGGWLGLPPTGRRIELRSLDFWRLEDGLIRENWVLVDLLHAWDQLGLDVLGRMREFNKARTGFDGTTGRALA